MDVVNDIFLTLLDRVVLYADRSKPENINLEVISGNLEIIGFEDDHSINLLKFFEAFDYDNMYGKIAGRMEYFQGVFNEVYDFSKPKDISFPIIHNDSRKWLRFNIFPSPKHADISIFTITDVTKLHTQEEETFAKTHLDSLTGLFNKYTFDYHYGLMYLLPDFHVMFMDLDNFKNINDQFGHPIGDLCLIAFSNLLKRFEDKNQRFYRLGGDEFVSLLTGSTESIKSLAANIVEQTRNLKIASYDIHLSISMGVMKATKSEALAEKADRLMYQVKNGGKNNFLYEIE